MLIHDLRKIPHPQSYDIEFLFPHHSVRVQVKSLYKSFEMRKHAKFLLLCPRTEPENIPDVPQLQLSLPYWTPGCHEIFELRNL